MRRAIFTLTTMASLILMAAIARADLITNWDYAIRGDFFNHATQKNNTGGIKKEGTHEAPGLSWGKRTYNYICLHSNTDDNGVLIANGPEAAGLAFSHINNDTAAVTRFARGVENQFCMYYPYINDINQVHTIWARL